jgi:hypothetical protein
MRQNHVSKKEGKMRKLSLFGLFLVLLVFLSVPAYLSIGEFEVKLDWAAVYGRSTVSEWAYDIAVDSLGNSYVTGSSFDLEVHTSQDFTTIKYDSNGNQIWDRVDERQGSGVGNAITLDSEGNVYVTGHGVEGEIAYDFQTIKYDNDGNELWMKFYNGEANDIDAARDIAVDSEGNVYVTGFTKNSSLYNDYTTIKYDSNGIELWVRKYDGGAATAIALDSSGNAYVTGGSNGTNPTIKYDADGDVIWVKTHSVPEDWCWNVAIAVDSEGNVYTAGNCQVANSSDYSFLIAKYDTDGNEIWYKLYQRSGTVGHHLNAMDIDTEGNVYVTGYSCYTYFYLDCDYLTLKLDQFGNELWAKVYNGPGSSSGFRKDIPRDLAADLLGNVYVTGLSYGHDTGMDFATIKYDASGNERWVQRHHGEGETPSLEDKGFAIAVDSMENVYVTGTGYVGEITTLKYKQRLDSEDKIDILLEDVDELLGAGNPLIGILTGAKNSLRGGDNPGTCIMLQHAFITQVENLIRFGEITEQDGQALIDAANEIINELCGE